MRMLERNLLVMTDRKARQTGIGGEVLGYVA